MAIGSVSMARIAHNLVHNREWPESEGFSNLPEGWRHLGSGATRHALLAPDGVVYKVIYDNYGMSDDVNKIEVAAAKRWRKFAPLADQNIFVPKMRLIEAFPDKEFGYITAMEFIDGKPTSCSHYSWVKRSKCNCRTFGTPRICFSVMHTMLGDWGMFDMFSANALWTEDNKIWIIDLGGEDFGSEYSE